MKKLLLAATLLAALPTPAAAAIILVTYTGTVHNGNDQTGFFGLGTNLTAVTPDPAFTLQFTVDTAHLGALVRSNAESQQHTGNGQYNPVIQSSFSLNGKTITWGNSPGDGLNSSYGHSDRFDEFDNLMVDDYDRIYNDSEDYGSNNGSLDYGYALLESSVNEIVNTPDLTAAIDYQVQAGDGSRGYFTTRRNDGSFTRNAYASLTPTRVTVTSLSTPVPEPATWAFMIVGFRAVGYSMRAARRKASLPAAA